MKNYLVTGGSGFIGSTITKSLIKKGYSVTVLDDFSRGNINKLEDVKNHISFVDIDIRNSEKVINIFKNNNFTGVIHLAYINGTENFYTRPEEVLEVAISGIQNIIQGTRLARIDEFYLASSSEVYQNPEIFPTPEDEVKKCPPPLSTYGFQKLATEYFCKGALQQYGLPYTIVRPFNCIGVGEAANACDVTSIAIRKRLIAFFIVPSF